MRELTTDEEGEQACPSCGRPTALTTYGPEPGLCVDCQRSLGVLREPAAAATPPPQDAPSWGVTEAILLLVTMVLSLAATEIGAVIALVVEARAGMQIPLGEAVLTDPTLTVVRIASSGAAHLVTFALAWYVVTDGGRNPFFASVGWGWRPRYTPATVVSVFLTLFAANILMGWAFHRLGLEPESTPFDEILKMPAARVAVALFAVVSAPFVEEVVFRGVLYPAVARHVGRVAAIVVVAALFLGVHVQQYAGSVAYLLPLGLLSLALTGLRAYSGSILPSFALHLLFNSVQVFFILSVPDR